MVEISGTTAPLLELRAIRKAFGAAAALRDVDLEVKRGEVHAVIGENGAGKSTLMRIIAGIYQPDRGVMRLRGAPYQPRSPAEARRQGIAMIHQELALCPHLTVLENLTLGQEQSRWGLLVRPEKEARAALGRLGHGDLPLDLPVRRLPIGLKQIVEIGRALWQNAEIIIMDEPTSSLSRADVETLFAVIQRLRDSGTAVIYISHFLEEVRRIADRYTVLRDGVSVAHGRAAETTLAALAAAMVGRPLDEMFPRVPHNLGEVLL
ncbi:MAG: ATP-binding cassette domain-containing protein, partial [Planctomycetota bacterium]|nr:ATP-binding cassette domain-containing protein [Planctomycetota bacterium]